MSIQNLIEEVNGMVDNEVFENMSRVGAHDLGLDDRCGYLWVNEEYIAVEIGGASRLDYYGGFEYVDSDYIDVLGGYKFYSVEDSRVADHVDAWLDKSLENIEVEYE